MRATSPAFRLDPLRLARGDDLVAEAVDWAAPRLGQDPILIYSSAPPEDVRHVQAELGRDEAGLLIERALAQIARRLVDKGVRRLVVAGGETAGAVVQSLGVTGIRIGQQIDPGVPWTSSLGEPALALALKSGNFGGPDFFLRAFERAA
jgi:uncharacterized protein YgbK (DUF1537 family)